MSDEEYASEMEAQEEAGGEEEELGEEEVTAICFKANSELNKC